ncbi:hypothetical protein [Aliivibrio fischeri]|uniref:hypothetical protein n=1 Tax=Aliivibrio fischeri TaxID=668 RepID=UPI0007C58B53|nr:hypothetical protein [Aliivibrio fischeri]MUK43108.1 hypothetical protein [Aliivibrio fischeri]TDM53547.1 hypothetical protein VFFQA001_02810 [Aliivibrio fischeri]
MKKLYVIAVLLFLSGCADHINEKQGTHINVIPVAYSFSINSQSDDIIKNKLNTFINHHGLKNKKGHWEISIYKDDIKEQEIKYQQFLGEFGYTINQIKTVELQDKPYFIVTVSFITQQIEYQICGYEQIDYYGSNNIGCYTESNRWHSMVNPENAM